MTMHVIKGRTVEQFYAFTDTRPDNEKWELIGGEFILNAAPSYIHQRIVRNVVVFLDLQQRSNPAWDVVADFAVHVNNENQPEPDVIVLPRPDWNAHHTDEPIVIFEVLSLSTLDRDLGIKRRYYTALPSLTHYVVIAQDAVEVAVFARSARFKEITLRSRDDTVDLGPLGVSLPVAEIYRDTGL